MSRVGVRNGSLKGSVGRLSEEESKVWIVCMMGGCREGLIEPLV